MRNLGPKTESRDISKRQWMLDEDYQGFSLAPKHLLEPYKADKAEHSKQYGIFERGNTSMGWPEGRNSTISEQLLCAMTKFVSCNHGWLKGGDIIPSYYLDIEITND